MGTGLGLLLLLLSAAQYNGTKGFSQMKKGGGEEETFPFSFSLSAERRFESSSSVVYLPAHVYSYANSIQDRK